MNNIRARFDHDTIRVYQAYRRDIAHAALNAGTFVAPFSMTRMTWIKPSFNWMMYRCGHASKDDQEVVLAIDITRDGFEWALANAARTHFQPAVHGTEAAYRAELAARPVRVQWDPERDWRLRAIDGVRAVQIGLGGEAVRRYVQDWIVRIEDVSPQARAVAEAIASHTQPAQRPWEERVYPVPASITSICLS